MQKAILTVEPGRPLSPGKPLGPGGPSLPDGPAGPGSPYRGKWGKNVSFIRYVYSNYLIEC